MPHHLSHAFAAGLTVSLGLFGAAPSQHAADAILKSQFIYEEAPFPSCHASTLEDTPDGLVAAWFGGTDEKHPDVGIWVSRLREDRWTDPVEVANGVESSSKRYPTWNPVLFQVPDGELMLFYKTGPSPSTWWGERKTSRDHGATWSRSERLPEGILGPIKNKPVLLSSGLLLSGSSTEHDGWTVHMEMSRDFGSTWTQSKPLNDPKEFGAIQPTLLTYPGGRIQALCRSQQGVVVELWSEDEGQSWGPMKRTQLPNPNAGLDGVTLKDGRQLLVYNHTPRGRSPLNVAVSRDGIAWTPVVALETRRGEYSYPAVIQSRDGKVHVSYTWKRTRIRHVVLDPERIP